MPSYESPPPWYGSIPIVVANHNLDDDDDLPEAPSSSSTDQKMYASSFTSQWTIATAATFAILLIMPVLYLFCSQQHFFGTFKVPRSFLLLMASPIPPPNFNERCIFTDVQCDTKRGECYIIPSQYESCMQSIQLNADHVLQTIRSLDDTFRNYYPFYYMAMNPNATEPKHYQQELGYEIYDAAKIDLHAILESIQEDVRVSGMANMATFWDVNEVFNLLRDAHVSAMQGNIGNLTSDLFSGRYQLKVFPERHKSSSEGRVLLQKTKFHFEDEQIHLNIERYDEQNSTVMDERRVASIDGLPTHDFLLHLSRSPMSSIAFKSVGPRINSLTYHNFPVTKSENFFFQTREGRKERIHPSRIFPDSFTIQYEGGGLESMHSRVVITPEDHEGVKGLLSDPSRVVLAVATSEIEKSANVPSCLHKHFLVGTRKAEKNAPVASSKNRRRSKKETADRDAKDGSSSTKSGAHAAHSLEKYCVLHTNTWFTKAYNCSNFDPPYDEDGPLEAAYKVMSNYVIFKLDSFDAPPDIIFVLWEMINDAAAKAGIDRLIVDISNNGGGEVPMGLNLARLMYPEVSCDMFDNKYDVVLNRGMHVWAQMVDPILQELENQWHHLIPAYDKVQIMGDIIENEKEVVHIVEAMCILDADHETDNCGERKNIRDDCLMYKSLMDLYTKQTVHSIDKFMQAYFDQMKESNPWSVVSEFDVSEDIKETMHIRGGVQVNYSDYLRHEPDFPLYWNCSVMDMPQNVFSSYILVGNGNSGSTASTFQSTVEQIWKNRDESGSTRPLTTVSFGGIPNDTPLTQFAGGTVVNRVNVEDPFVGLVGLHLLATFMTGSKTAKQLRQALEAMGESLPEVPFYLQQFSRLPAFEIYNYFMLQEGEAIPLEFIYMPPDRYIRTFYFGGIFDSSGGLEGLYEEASNFVA